MTSREDYFRVDQQAGITAPDLSKSCGFTDHIVKARGKRTAFTSVSLDRQAIVSFGTCDYLLLRDRLHQDNHQLVEHGDLVFALQATARAAEREDRTKAIQALRLAKMRKEGLINWTFDISGIDRKSLITWAHARVQHYFQRA